MMTYPKVSINLNTIKNNAMTLVNLCAKSGISVAGVTKVFRADPKIVNAYIEGGVKYLADSRVENLMKLKDIDLPKIMLRLPMISKADQVVEYADISLNAEIQTIKVLSEKALEKNKVHQIILMVDLGDLREGYYNDKDLFLAIDKILELKGIKLIGLGTNLTCYGGVIPTKNNLKKLDRLREEIKYKYNIDLEVISGGNSSSIYLLEENNIDGINNLRLGESIVLGGETAYGNKIEGTRDDAFILKVEVIEVKEKPSLPSGEIGKDAFGRTPTFVDRGVRKRIICAIGKQDIEFDGLIAIDKDIIILGGSSDHLLLDGSDSKLDYEVGDIIEFKLTYGGILSSMTSQYVEKEYI